MQQLLDSKAVEAGVTARLTSGSAWLAWARDLHRAGLLDDEVEATIYAAMTMAQDRERQWALGAPDIT